ncbi:hypothetical protein CTAYLR_005266 [Chrysophaeum taylorii]|uniref:RNA helicase n=1 Tax=Chrysophaeum taylorii TaxID=2483200 RepID=A0AAD7UJP8_9STRA|nr:hypothetical protein CTAYLR_005266 [Chrysophaeum taylorii]
MATRRGKIDVPRLPIAASRDALLWALETHSTLIVVGETGSGKSTQLPKYLLEAGWCAPPRCAVVAAPRRIAATSLAERVAEELGCDGGSSVVGYAVRHDERWDPERTRLKFTTDGWLLREALFDPLFAHYSVVVVDEVHERSVATDLLLGLLKKVQRARSEKKKPLRIIASSATADVETLRSFFGASQTAVASIEGRPYPVDVFFAEHPLGADYVLEAARLAARVHREEGPGDVLVFLPGPKEVDECVRLVRDDVSSTPGVGGCEVLPLYASLDPRARTLAAKPTSGGRKIVVATNVAETSLTVPGVQYVIDAGFSRLAMFDAASASQLVVTTPVSRISAAQRAGRAGRTAHGKCYRLYTRAAFHELLPERSPPEIQRTDLAWPLLQLKALAVDNILDFDFVEPPPSALLVAALDELRALGALDDRADLTAPLGERLALAPCEPRLARALLASLDLGCAIDLVDIAAVLETKRPLRSFHARLGHARREAVTRQFRDDLVNLDGDHLTYAKALRAYDAIFDRPPDDRSAWCRDRGIDESVLVQARAMRPRLLDKWLGRIAAADAAPVVAAPEDDTVPARKALVAGFFSRAARFAPDATYRAIKGDRAIYLDARSVHAEFGTPPDYVCFCDYALDDRFDIVARHVARVNPQWLLDAGDYYRLHHAADHPSNRRMSSS